MTFFVNPPIEYFIPLYVIHLVFYYDIDFLKYLASFLRRKNNRGKRRKRQIKNNCGASARLKAWIQTAIFGGDPWSEGVFKDMWTA
jgi:hypothetical protein